MPRGTSLRKKVDKLRGFVVRERRMPGYEEMLTLFDYRSKNAVHQLLLRLRDAGPQLLRVRQGTARDWAAVVLSLLVIAIVSAPSRSRLLTRS